MGNYATFMHGTLANMTEIRYEYCSKRNHPQIIGWSIGEIKRNTLQVLCLPTSWVAVSQICRHLRCTLHIAHCTLYIARCTLHCADMCNSDKKRTAAKKQFHNLLRSNFETFDWLLIMSSCNYLDRTFLPTQGRNSCNIITRSKSWPF